MSTKAEAADALVDLLNDALGARRVTARRMFGEFGLYCDGRFFAVICDDTLLLKPLPELRAAMGTPEEAPPHPRAKPWLRPSGEDLDDPARIARLVQVALDHLPPETPRKRRGQAAIARAGNYITRPLS